MTKTEMLEKILRDINNIGGVEAVALGSRDGLLICSTMAQNLHAQAFVAMLATMLGAAEVSSAKLGKSIPDRIIVDSKNGKIIVKEAGKKALLGVMTRSDVPLGMVLIGMIKASESIVQIMG
ncbi:MAG: roadblock/LC7 domain-containing protein [Candidatus Methanoperedens sp.]|nr:roadblock/LC7 domain-containing protein [Candidatus Methanoperedens sp.]MCZ7358471.1 roadblock/LC7 domain-containing protein [Candidatus Methanoperedens sp.]HLB69962.1 roadblock/LC7 domain-containing protein [Candidatus Methanoperedens sp.]